jgi:membrane-bound lytic murein transglycosylase D
MRSTALAVISLFSMVALSTGQTRSPQPSTPAPAEPEPDALYELGAQLFEQYAPPEIKEKLEFLGREQWDAFVTRLQEAMESESLEELGAYAPDVRTAMLTVRMMPGYEDVADWLSQRLDEFEAAQEARRPGTPALPPRTAPSLPGAPAVSTSRIESIPYYELWLARVRDRPVPARAAALMPRLRAGFIAEGVAPELAWLAEAESSFNPLARSPVGAKGLFQFMPETARSLGLSTFLPDDRTDPDKSARAAARYLKKLHGRFGTWPLALAAYNAGEGRVGRTLTAEGATDYAGISHALPAETRMYVPKVYALIAMRAGVAPDEIAAPRR